MTHARERGIDRAMTTRTDAGLVTLTFAWLSTHPQVVRFAALLFRRISRRKPAMSATTTVAPIVTPNPSIWDAVHKWGDWAFQAAQTISTDWATAQASPTYGPLIAAAENAAKNELAAKGVDVAPLVAVGASIQSAVTAMAQAHPGIATP